MSKRHACRFPLIVKYAVISVVALLVAFLVYYSIYDVATNWYLNDERFSTYWGKKGDAYLAGFQTFILENELTYNQALTDMTWTHEHYTMATYLEPDYSSEAEGVYYPIGEGPADYGLTPLQCSDGVIYATSYPSELYYYSRARAIGLILGAVCFLLLSVPFILHVIKKISQLQHSVGVLASGILTQRVDLSGRDEIGELGRGIDQMRRSLLSAIENERTLTESNRQLVSSLSHDLRTPLTQLLGYLELLQAGSVVNTDADGIVIKATEKARQLRTLTNELFMQAAYSGSAEQLQFEVLPGAELFSQLFEEWCFELQSDGFQVEGPAITSFFSIEVRVMDIIRVFDNVFSNIKKYGDRKTPIQISISESMWQVLISITNGIAQQETSPESHRLGVPSMERLLACNGGTLEISQSTDTYKTIIYIPKLMSQANDDS